MQSPFLSIHKNALPLKLMTSFCPSPLNESMKALPLETKLGPDYLVFQEFLNHLP